MKFVLSTSREGSKIYDSYWCMNSYAYTYSCMQIAEDALTSMKIHIDVLELAGTILSFYRCAKKVTKLHTSGRLSSTCLNTCLYCGNMDNIFTIVDFRVCDGVPIQMMMVLYMPPFHPPLPLALTTLNQPLSPTTTAKLPNLL